MRPWRRRRRRSRAAASATAGRRPQDARPHSDAAAAAPGVSRSAPAVVFTASRTPPGASSGAASSDHGRKARDGAREDHVEGLATARPRRAAANASLRACTTEALSPMTRLGDGRLEEGALLRLGVEQHQPRRRPGDGERDARHAGAGAEVEPAVAGATQSRHVEERQRIAEEPVDGAGARAHAGDVSGPPAEKEVEVAAERRGLDSVQTELGRQLVQGRHGGESSSARRTPVGATRRRRCQASRRLVRTSMVPPSGGHSRLNSSTTARMIEMPMPPSPR